MQKKKKRFVAKKIKMNTSQDELLTSKATRKLSDNKEKLNEKERQRERQREQLYISFICYHLLMLILLLKRRHRRSRNRRRRRLQLTLLIQNTIRKKIKKCKTNL